MLIFYILSYICFCFYELFGYNIFHNHRSPFHLLVRLLIHPRAYGHLREAREGEGVMPPNPRAYGLGQRHITVSTIGLTAGIEKLASEDLQIGLAVSLHAPNDKLRKQLVPTASPNSVSEIISAGRKYFKKTGRRVTFEYALIDGVNDTPEIAKEMARLLEGNGSHVNLIPLNPTAGEFTRPTKKRILDFERILFQHGINCTVRVEKGAEIAAACGQLRTDILNQQKSIEKF